MQIAVLVPGWSIEWAYVRLIFFENAIMQLVCANSLIMIPFGHYLFILKSILKTHLIAIQ